MNLDELRGNPLPEPPEHIKNMAENYLRDGEVYNIYPQRAVVNGSTFYNITYGYSEKKVNGILIVKEDGTLPLHKDCVEVYHYITDVESGLKHVFTYGSKWSERPMGIWKKLQSLLDSFADTVNASNDPSFKKGYEIFCSIPQTMFETQEELKQVVENAKKQFTELTTDYLVTKDIYEKVRKNFERMMDIQKIQFEVQIETEEERTKFMKQLKASISFLDLSKQVSYMRLNKLHKWLNADKATMAEYEDFKNDVYRDKANKEKQKKQIESIRNPRD
ncbi:MULTISPECIES: hypothetical protein [Thermoactinomyces]|jgi:hypothetical protein|uniref:hypothetical protein n=1 Tax=Thermoactinomyces TaxID=2023 RepID=UPI0005001AEA|nr:MULTISPECIES: hypothetical protein [Thermoactinomyces]KFZ41062.1 hypothetical protein JS81_02990 [Thermoactinomyces sp. Gus2-1]MBH8584994.1 hypothetical protein [Thermoactinomyces sp. CICC 10520]MBI0390974.1 hypothetical protein [Thermoactinomyces sp. CICC 24226]MCF6134236.1 hypothetical protein [Thermoactinomyces vulgaris]QCV55721.1 hypothetical protein FA954_08910 [Thermoactinomyces vulgaris]